MEYKTLSIKGTILNQNQLEDYLETIATDHNLQNNSNKNTYPIPRLKENFEVITEVYRLLNEHIKLKIPIHPAGEWILDNYYIVDQTVKSIKQDLSLKKYKRFLGIANGNYKGFARIYVLASEIVNYTNNKIEGKSLSNLLQAYQKKKSLSMEEIWNINLFLNLALIENIRAICEKIYSVQVQKYKVENMIERLVENKDKDELQYNHLNSYKEKVKGYGEMKYPFIEYLSYRLKKYGKKAYPFLMVLEEQVNKMGMTVSEVVEKEHFDIALRKVAVGNCITSIKTLSRISMAEIFEKINGVEDILKQDPAGVYEKMDYETKIAYRNQIQEISQSTKISEVYISKKCLELSQKAETPDKKSHIGYYLLDEGKQILLEELTGKKQKRTSTKKKVLYAIMTLIILTIGTSGLMAWYLYIQTHKILWSIILGILLLIPIQTIWVQIGQYILGKFVKPKIIPKLDYIEGVPPENATFVVIPTILKSKEKVKELMEKLEVYYMANKSDNLYFAILGDCSAGKNQKEPFDEEVIESGQDVAKQLNEKYPDENFPKFHFLYRQRVWNEKEECYLGWERKRGLLNQFNEYILGKESNNFQANTIEKVKGKLPKIKYVITLDADTQLSLNTGLELIGGMAHILNMPILNERKDLVVQGHALLQPRVGISLLEVGKSIFTKIYAGSGGKDAYTNAISDIYQDNFEEGIFTGKGIYDVEVFSTVLSKEIPENTVLSHDLLEGSYLRCGLASDIVLMDGYPTGYNSFKTRLHRWIRGDWQVAKWLGNSIYNKQGNKKRNPLNLLSRYKIFDNLLRSLNESMIMITIIYMGILDMIYSIEIGPIITIAIISAIIPMLLEIINRIIFKKEAETVQKTFTATISGVKASFIRAILAIAILPDKAYFSLNACIKTLYRMIISKKHFLEWMTAEEAEKTAKKDLLSYYRNMVPNIIIGALGILLLFILPQNLFSVFLFILSSLWLFAPAIMCYISKEIKIQEKIEQIKPEEQKYLLEIGQKTWKYFKDYLTPEFNYLPPDNYQEDRKPKVVSRTSSTNIGLALLAVISSYDLGYENIEDTIKLLEKMIDIINNLPKWNGHLYNWYDIQTLQPLKPRYVSSVDSGNFVGYLFVVKQFLEEQTQQSMLPIINHMIEQTDFKKLYDEETRLFSIGFNVEENKLTDCYYDLLASEARQASLVAIAKKDVPAKHWNNLSRTLTILNQYKGLISWSGTAFEYLMPNMNIPKYPGSLLAESTEFMLMCQKEYAKKLHIPWGISESAFYLRDLHNNYQYKAFGIPWLGLKRGLEEEMVVASYGSILALPEEPKEVIENLKKLEQTGMYQKYGFYEAIDYTPTRLKKGQEYAIVKTYMAHHQGLILLAINNLFHQNILPKRFMKNPQIQAIDILLQEKMPENIIITKEEKEKIEKMKYIDDQSYTQKEITKPITRLPQVNVLSNENYTIMTDSRGLGYSKYGDILINRYKKTEDIEQGIFFFLKNVKTNRIWTTGHMSYLANADKYNICFTPAQTKITRQDGNIETISKIGISPDEPVELRTIELTNHGIEPETLEITSYLEPVLSEAAQEIAHPAFNKLFLNYEYLDSSHSILVSRRTKSNKEQKVFLGTNFYTENETIGEVEYEIDKEKFYGRNNLGLPNSVKNSAPFSNQMNLTTEPIISMKQTITVLPEQKVTLNFILAVGETKEQVIEEIEKFRNQETINYHLELAKAKVEAANRYLGIQTKELDLYQKMAGYLLKNNPLKILTNRTKVLVPVSKLWQYGISGDLPILLLRIKNLEEIELVEEALKAYEYFKLKNIQMDLVIVSEEKYSYESRVKEAVFASILNKGLSYLQNIKGGIFILENLSEEEIDFLEYRANLSFNGNSTISRHLKELEEEYLEKIKEVPREEPSKLLVEQQPIRENLETENLKYYNDFGGFSEDGTEYHICIHKGKKLPTVWSHLLTNPNFGTLVTESMGGYTWYKNSRLNRITAWNNQPIMDVPSEVIYMQDSETKKIWSLGFNPCPDENDYHITYGFGYAKYKHANKGITQKLDVFVPMKDNVKVQMIQLENNELHKKKYKLIYYVKPVLEEDELKSHGFLNLDFYENANMICMQNISSEENNQYLFVSSNEKITSYTGSKTSFFGKGNLTHPDGIDQIELNKESSLWQDGIIAVQCEVELEALESKKIIFTLGVGKDILECQDLSYQYRNISKIHEEYENTKKYWKQLLEKVQVTTPLESTNILLNGWLLYQVITSRLWGKTGYYQSGGALGFRDQLQDCLSLKYVEPEMLKNQILKHAAHQFIEGDVEHWWHEETSRGIRTKFSDDRLWLVYLTEEYIEFTGDKGILETIIPYLAGEPLTEEIDENYDLYLPSEQEGTLYEHCKKAIQISLNFGENGLPKIGSGDWNDGFSTVGNQGKGESIWLGFFLYDILKRFIPICQEKKEEELAKYYEQVMEKLKRALNSNGWDGRWFKRAFMDNGNVLGSIQNEECRIDAIAQSWAVISGAGDNDKKYISMQSLENHLIDKENGIIKLLDPPFDKGNLEPGYIKAYIPGTRENGGQYTHGAIWAVVAEAMLGFGDKAGELYRMINPIEHSRTKEAAIKYKVEPYVICADIAGQRNLAGRGGWTWYTGSSSWMYETGIKYILGLRIHQGKLFMEPCIPSSWKEYSIKYQYKNTKYHIQVNNPNGKTTGVTSFKVNGEEVEEKQIKLEENGGIYKIEIEM